MWPTLGRIAFRIANRAVVRYRVDDDWIGESVTRAGEQSKKKARKRLARERCRQCGRQNHDFYLTEWWSESQQRQEMKRNTLPTWFYYCPEHPPPPSAGLTNWDIWFAPQESAQDQPSETEEAWLTDMKARRWVARTPDELGEDV